MEFSPIIFLTGHRKSGTSVFHRLFDGYPEVTVYPVDLSFLYAYFPAFTENRYVDAFELRKRLCLVIARSLQCHASYLEKRGFCFDRFAKSVESKLSDEEMRDRFAVLRAVQSSWMNFNRETASKPFVVKETSQSIFFSIFREKDCRTKMITVIRDPRDNYAALKAGVAGYYSKMGEGDLVTLASLINRCRMDFLSALANEAAYPEDFMALKFENLVNRPESEMRSVADFLKLPYDPVLIYPTESGEEYKGNSHEGTRFSGLSSRNVSRWRSRISEEEAKVIEYWMRDVMEKFSYEPTYSEIDAQNAFSRFYEWYNTRYFYKDSFQQK